MSTYCLDLYGYSLWNYSKDRVNDMFVAWRKVVRGLWKLPNMTHCNLLSTINSSLPIEIALEKRCAKFIHSCLNSNNLIIKTTSISDITILIDLSLGITIDIFVINTKFQDIYVFYQLEIYYSIFKISLSNMLYFA